MAIHSKILFSSLLSLCFMAALPASAREEGPCHNTRPHGARNHHEPVEFGPLHFLHHMQLSEAQRDQVFRIMHDQAPARRVIEKELHKARTALLNLTLSEKYSETKAKRLIDAETQANANLMRQQIETMHRIYGLLTADQRRKVDERDSLTPPHQ